MLISLIIEKFFLHFSQKTLSKKNKLLEEFLKKALSEAHPEKKMLAKKLQNPWFLAEGLFKANLADSSKKAKILAESLAARYLIAFARRSSQSLFHKKRLLSARIFTLYTSSKDAPYLKKLLDDNNLLIVGAIAEASTKFNERESVEKTLKKMSFLPSYIYNMLKDVFIAADPVVHATVEKILKENPSSEVAISAIDILSTVNIQIPKAILQKAMRSDIPLLKEAALKAHIACPHNESEKVFFTMLDDQDPTVRQLAAKGLALFPSSSCAHRLESALSDHVWQVRVEAASSLHLMGKIGHTLLEKAAKSRNENAKNSALFILKVAKELSI